MAIYRLDKHNLRRIAPLASEDFGQVHNPTLSAEGYYIEVDVHIPLLPQSPLQPTTCVSYQFLTNPGFTPGEYITGAPGLGVEELDFTANIPVPGFVRGEVITDAVLGTAIVARRYSNNKYLVYNVTAVWGGGAVTGALGGGGTTPGIVAGNVAASARFASVHQRNNEDNTNLFYENNMFFPPGCTLAGVTSGIIANPLVLMAPQLTAELKDIKHQVDTVMSSQVQGVMFKAVLLYGDLAQLMNSLAAAADFGQRRVTRGEMAWNADVWQGVTETTATTSFDMQLMRLPGNYDSTVPAPTTAFNTDIPAYKDGAILRLYVGEAKAGAVAALVELLVARQITYNELWNFQSVIHRNGQ